MTKDRTAILAALITVLAACGLLAAGAGTAGAGPVAGCPGSAIAVATTTPGAAAGQRYMSVLLRNRSVMTCSLIGYPGFDALASNRSVLAHAQRVWDGMPITSVVLAPGQTASAVVHWSAVQTGSNPCTAMSASIATTPPNTYATHYLPVQVGLCDLWINPVRPGTGIVGVPGCPGAAIGVTTSAVQGAAGSRYFALLLRNRSAVACSLIGYPGLDALAANGSVLEHAQRVPDGRPITSVVLFPGDTASGLVHWSAVQQGSNPCTAMSASIATTPPNTYATHYLPLQVGLCDLWVNPVRPAA